MPLSPAAGRAPALLQLPEQLAVPSCPCSQLLAAANFSAERVTALPAWTPGHRCARYQERRRRRSLQAAADAATPGFSEAASSAPELELHVSPVPSPDDLASLARDTAAFTAALRRLAGPGSGCTEAHVVAAWAAQRRSPALQACGPPTQQAAALQALVALEELTRRQVVALTPDQLGFVFRCDGGCWRAWSGCANEKAGRTGRRIGVAGGRLRLFQSSGQA